MKDSNTATFPGLIDLASAELGGQALGTSDDFFAGMQNMLLPGRGVFIEGKYTDRGKWMDGWESRRKRTPGHDHCVIELGVAGQVLAFDIDTHHFVGNHPPFASVEGAFAPKGSSYDELQRGSWRELLPQSPLRPDAQNLFATVDREPVSHLRLNIFPDGGVARFRAYGRVQPDLRMSARDEETLARVPPQLIDLAAVTGGGLALACSDAFFGPMNNLLLPGRAENMGGGWETRRKRAPGHDWILLKLGARGTAQVIEVDTNHFKGNYPDRCSIEGIDATTASITELIASPQFRTILPEQKLSASTRHFFRAELAQHAPVSHLRLNIFPDGGVSRLRVWGEVDG
ncbi:MAG TPA: allantoicase [Polyangiales bacterium]